MSLFQYLQLQPIDPQEDGTLSELDQYAEDDTIDLSYEPDGEELVHEWELIEHDMHDENVASSLAAIDEHR